MTKKFDTTYKPREKKKYLGSYSPKTDAKDKTLGKVEFFDDATLKGKIPGMLHCRILESPYPHAKILEMDTSKAENYPGVYAVLRCDDPEIRALGRTTHAWTDIAITPKECDTIDRFWDRVFLPNRALWAGDQVGVAVAAETQEIAEEALKLVDIKWEILPEVFEMDDAKKPDAPIIHYEMDPDTNQLRHGDDTVVDDMVLNRGDVDKAMEEADFTFEITKQFGGSSTHGCLDYRGCVVSWTEDKINVWTNHYMADQTRMFIHDYTGVPLNKVRVINGNSGAHMGKWNTGEDQFYIIAAFLSKRAGRPVKYKMNNHEEFHEVRSENRYKIKVGCMNDGKITAMDVIAEGNTGAYVGGCDHNVEFIVVESFDRIFAPVENARIHSYTWFTDKMPGGVVRGIGNVQMSWAFNPVYQHVADHVGKDITEIYKMNCGNSTNWKGEVNKSIEAVIDRGAELIGWENRKPHGQGELIDGYKRKGYGMAIWNQWHAELDELTRGFYEVSIRLNPDMSVIVQAPTSETGAGSNSAVVLAVAENLQFLNITPDDILWTPKCDTELTLRDNAPTDSAVSFLYAEAIYEAGIKMKRAVLERVSDYMQIDPDLLDVEDAYVFEKANPENRVHVGWCMLHTDCVPIHIHHARHNVREQAGLPFGAWFVEVEVDTELGTVEVTDMAVVNDAGCVLHASGCESHQISGQCFGVGETLTEEMHYDWETGTPLNNNYIDYKMLTMADRPNVTPELLEVWKGLGRYGAAGVAEGAFCGTGAAIANAVYNAVGVEVDAQPITPQKVMKGMEELKAAQAAAAQSEGGTSGECGCGCGCESGKEGR